MIDRLQAQMQAMQMLMKMQDVTANNLANINTPGFKGSNTFQNMVQKRIDGKMVTQAVPQQQVDMQQGVLEPTGNPLDFGIKGKGFFVVENGEGAHLSRDGRMHFNSNGFLVDENGSRVMGDSGPIYMPEYLKATGRDGDEATLDVADDGTIRLDGEVFDRLRIVQVEDTSKLERRGNNYLSAPEEAMADDSSSKVMQGYYESSNVDPLTEMVDMMKTTKMFESQQRAMTTTDQMMGRATQQLGKF
ncbi:flagellar hook-basal body protein [Fodinibius salsisoli]|uniref:Flagellar hook basal-body protein n=1 Tax=Fodinibius salsisoli TaxID=2820877 RepID=A0ABT3PHV3_9BACT|nr:flagellar hook basal-body protein [Fodinibius salsisoli]MCW9705358.1 flagellar hook basal-body protein [Fodinibius salsisoli]